MWTPGLTSNWNFIKPKRVLELLLLLIDIIGFEILFTDCEKSLENVPSHVYDSVCGPDISEFLGNQRLSSNQQDFANEKNFSVPSGE